MKHKMLIIILCDYLHSQMEKARKILIDCLIAEVSYVDVLRCVNSYYIVQYYSCASLHT